MKKPNISNIAQSAKWLFCLLFLCGNVFASTTSLNHGKDLILCDDEKEKPLTLALILSVQNPSCYGYTNGAIYTEVSGGVAPYYYLWSNDNADTAPHLLGIGHGTYYVTITDSNGDIIVGEEDVVQPPDIIATMTSTDAFCSTGGTANVSCTGGVPPFSYLWDNGSTTTTSIDLDPGLVSVTVTDATSCVTIHTVSIGGTSSSSLGALIIDQEYTTCAISQNGYAEAKGFNGSGNYTYLWPDGQTTALATGLDVGTYEVTVSDGSGCYVTTTATIDLHPEGVWVTVYGNDASCNENDGSATANAMLGTPPYTYLWNTNATTATIDNISSGSYSVTVTDAEGCSKSGGVYIDQQSSSGLSLFTTSSYETCSGSNDASATAVASGGNPPYTYTWDNGYVGYKNPNLGADTYGVTVVDSDGCSTSASETVEISPEGVWLMVSGDDASCCANDGTAHVSIMTGDAPYIIEWSNGHTGSSDPDDLAPGEYCVTVTDANNCSNTECISIESTNDLSIDISATNAGCSNGNTGSATASPCTSGSFTYNWSNGQTGATASNLSAGSYDVTVQNSAGCYGVESVIIINEGGNLSVQINNPQNVSCFGGSDGSANVSASGGSGNYSYLWSDGQTSSNATGLNDGIISVVVSDNTTGCSGMASVNISEPTQLELNVTGTDVTCNGLDNGTATATATGGTTPYSYSWSNNGNSSNINNLANGIYNLTVTDNNNCTMTGSVTIENGSSINVSIININEPSCFNGQNGSATADPTGGNLPYTYAWSNGANTGIINGLAAGTISVTVTDVDGCSGEATSIVTQPNELEVSLTATDETCGGDGDGTASTTVTGGTGPFGYLWNNGATSPNLTNLAPGNYNLTVTDANNCIAQSISVTIEAGTSLNVTTTPTYVSCFGGNDGTMGTNTSGGTGTYTYFWSNGATTSSINNLIVGLYEVTVTDNDGCSGTASGIVMEPTQLVVTPTGSDESCATSSNGEAYANPTGGTAPYTYLWNTGATSPFLLNLPAGTYTVVVTDANDCTEEGSFVVNAGGLTTCSAAVTSSYNEGVDISTLSGNDGEATASIAGGSSPVVYNWSNGQTGAIATGLNAGSYTVTVSDASSCTCEATVTLLDPAKLGNFVWEDLDKDGIQDSGESGIEGVQATLTGTSATGVDVMRMMFTGTSGMYMFDGLPPGSYKVTFDKPDGYKPTDQNIGSDEALDSDADPTTGMTDFYTLTNGEYNPNVDAGYYGCVSIGNFVWNDLDKDGLQDINDGGFAGLLVRLYSTGPDGIPCNADDYIVDFETTNTAGEYYFECVEPGEYYIQFVHPGIPSTYMLSPDNVGSDDTIDSDADPSTGKTPTFTVVPGQADNFSFDAGISPNCNNVNDGGQIGYSQTVCAGFDSDTLVNTTNPNGGSGVLEYVWLESLTGTGPVGGSGWTEIPNSNTPYYYPGVLIQSTYFVRCARRAGCNSYFESNFVVVEVVPFNPNTCSNSPIFGNFTATVVNDNDDIELKWSTTEELDAFNYYIEYSRDNETFESIGIVSGSGIGSINNEYNFMDKSLDQGIHYYRIKGIGLQSIIYSEALLVTIHNGLGDLVLYPNPATSVLYISTIKALQVEATLEIYNSIGQLLDKLKISPEMDQLEYDLKNLTTGSYFIRLEYADNVGENSVYKFIKK